MAITKFRPCIDLHEGQVKQIVGGTLTDEGAVENFVAKEGPAHFAGLFSEDQCTGGHLIQLGPGNAEAAQEALATWRGGMQLGGGVTLANASKWLEAGASAVIVTSYLFKDEQFSFARLRELAAEIGPENLVVDLSCRRVQAGWQVAMNRWQTLTDLAVNHAVLDDLAEHCGEFLIHAADVEGKCGGVDEDLVERLGGWIGRPMTYAGGVGTMADLEIVNERSNGNVDVTVGSALDIFGGKGITYRELIAWNQREVSA